MAIELERLIATLEARLDKYEKGLARARAVGDQQFGRIERRGKQMEASLGRLGIKAFGGFARGAIGALLPVLSVAAAINTAKAAMKEFGDVADNSRASGLDPEFFQGLSYQVSLAGVSFEQSASALATFAKNSGLAAAGKGKMITALKALNPELLANIQAATSQEQRIRLVADAMAKEEDASKRAAIATAAFGEAGAKMGGALQGGAAAIDATMVKAREMGLIVDRELIARADALGDEFDTATRIVDLQLKQALVNLGPVLIWLAGRAGDLAGAFSGIFEEFSALGDRSTGKLVDELNALRADKQRERGDPLGIIAAQNRVRGVDARIAQLGREIFGRGEQRSLDLLKTTTPPRGEDIPDLDEAADSIRRLHSEYDAWADDGVQKLIDKHQEWAETMSGAVVDGVESIWEAFKRGENVLDAILAKALALGEQLAFGALQSLLTGALTGNMGGAFTAPTSFVPGGFFPAFRAAGGPVQGGRPYVVGERGPEMFVPPSAGRIMPRVPGGAGGGATVNNFYIDAKGAEIGVEDKIVRAIRAAVPQMIAQQAPAAVARSQIDRKYG